MEDLNPSTTAREASTEAAPRGRREGGHRRERRSPRREGRQRSEFDQKIISIRRVTRVVAGGRRFSFSVSIVSGDRKGSVGVGIGKASDTALAIDKATRDAKKHMVKVPLTKEGLIPHPVEAKYAASRVLLSPARGRGLVAGSSVRVVLELAGITNITSKVLSRSRNQLNNARVTVKALGQLKIKN
jgi:small subunit ribosomal protein S5